ncbi:phage protein Gp36 family protein [Porphyromonas gingivicanis]|uniref:phage protein Gp36 family protein n=1 Tax=Porphyromonas gingivicanis TaxID=266762 RepID=UPI0009DE7A2C|nr:phage protein Gp36 family protein [Porphyromonas gingivicanis]
MIVNIEEMITVVDSYKLQQITDNTDAITETCLKAAEARVLSYLSNKYDVEEIQRMSSQDPALADLKEMIKDIALYYIMRRHNVDIAYESVREAYKLHQEYLKGIATETFGIIGLPPRKSSNGKISAHLVMGSRPKQDFEY